MANIVIDIASEFTGAKAFKQADSATSKLTKGVKTLAATVGLAYSGTQVLAFAKSSVKAAAADQKAQQQLALALKNVGLERDAASAEGFIQRLQSEFGIVDDLLRPAYQSLAIATRDTAEAQRLLNLSLDISAATGKDLGSVTAALSKAYLGNNTALTRLGVGISKADLKTKSFYDITTDLADTFKGSATAAANTFQGSMDKLAVASANVQEIIGTGIIDALTNLGNDNSVSDLAKSMEDAALFTADLIRGVGVLTEKLKALPGVSGLKLGMIPIVGSYLEGLSGLGKQSRTAPKPFSTGMSVSGQTQTKAVGSSQIKVQKEILKANKDSLKLAKARAVFDLQKIQIEAALKGKISAEDEIRLKLMKAIEEENLTNIEKYQKALTVAQEKSKELNTLLTTIKLMEIKDPFGLWKIDPITASINELTKSMFSVQTQIQANGKEWSSFASTVGATVLKPNLTEWTSSFGAAGSAASAAAQAALKAQQDALAAQSKAATEALAAGSAAAEAAAAAQIKAAAEAAAAQSAAIAGASAEQKAALQAQLAAQQAALVAANAAALAALKARLAEEAAAAQEAADAAQANAEATLLENANNSAVRNAAILAARAAAEAAAAKAALDAASSAASASSASTTTASKIEVTVTGDPFTDPNVIAEKIVQIITSANERGTTDVLGFG
jgi:hypothetical protein